MANMSERPLPIVLSSNGLHRNASAKDTTLACGSAALPLPPWMAPILPFSSSSLPSISSARWAAASWPSVVR